MSRVEIEHDKKNMDTSIYIKKCPRCKTKIVPQRHVATGDNLLAGFMGLCGGIVGVGIGVPADAARETAIGYLGNKATIMSIENGYDKSQWVKYKCSICGCEWNEKIHTNDHLDDSIWMANAPY